jgi:hypothetical protein
MAGRGTARAAPAAADPSWPVTQVATDDAATAITAATPATPATPATQAGNAPEHP